MKKIYSVLLGVLILISVVTAVTVIKGEITEENLNDVEFGAIRGSVLSEIIDQDNETIFSWRNGIYSVFAVPQGESIPQEELNKIVCNEESNATSERIGEFSIRDDEGTRLVFSERWDYGGTEFYRVISEPSNYICPWECQQKYNETYEGETGDYMLLAMPGEYDIVAIDTKDSSICSPEED